MQRRWHWITGGACLLIIATTVLACGTTAPASTVSKASHTRALIGCTATATVSSSSRSSGNPLDGATFGGPLCAFSTKYGDQYLTVYRINGLQIATDSDEGVDGLEHVRTLDISLIDRSATWTMQQAFKICQAYLPPDAIYQRDDQDQYGDVYQSFTSARLAATFPPSSPGYDPTGLVIITYSVNVSGVFGCLLEDHR